MAGYKLANRPLCRSFLLDSVLASEIQARRITEHEPTGIQDAAEHCQLLIARQDTKASDFLGDHVHIGWKSNGQHPEALAGR